MAISEDSRKAVDDFFAAIEPMAHAYRNNSFTFLAVKNGAQFTLVQAALLLVVPSSFPFSSFASASVLAGHHPLKESARRFVESLLDGKIRLPGVDIEFPASHAGGYLATY